MGSRIRTGVIATASLTVQTIWLLANKAVSIINLPSDASDAWNSLVGASPWYPAILAGLSIAALAWAIFSPSKTADSIPVDSPPHRVSPPQGNTFVGDYDERLAAGSGNTVVSHVEALRSGNAIGSGSHHHPESASIGAGAGIGSGVTADEGVSALTNHQLRQRTRSLIDRLRELQRNVRTEHTRIIFSKDADGRHEKLNDLSEKLLTSFNAHYKGECRILRSAIKDRLGIFSDDITVRERALDFGHLTGPQPIEEIATYFEDLLAKLPA